MNDILMINNIFHKSDFSLHWFSSLLNDFAQLSLIYYDVLKFLSGKG